MNEKIESLEMALRNVSTDNENLQRQCQKKKWSLYRWNGTESVHRQNEELLKQVIARTAKVYGIEPIREIIESIASDSTAERILHGKSQSRSSFESKRFDSNPMQGGINHRNIISHASQYYGYGVDDDFLLKNNMALSNPFMRTISSVSTLPELNHAFDFYQSFDERADQEPHNETSYSHVSSWRFFLLLMIELWLLGL